MSAPADQPRKRILFVQPSLQPPGGGNGVAAWMLQSLAPVHEVTLLVWTPLDVAEIDRHYGTSLGSIPFEVVEGATPSLRQVVDRLALPLFLVRASLLQRRSRALADRFDLVMTAANELDLGRRGVQYIHYPWSSPHRPAEDLRPIHRLGLLAAYRWLCRRIGGTTVAGLRRNLTLVNSDWTGARVREHLGIETVTVYPPMMGEAPPRPWEARRDGFVCVGRIVPDKEIEKVVAIVAALRERGHPVVLRLLGAADGPPTYVDRVRALAAAHADWLTLETDVSRDRLLEVIAENRYGIHGKVEEHFGMGAMEMVLSGAIVFLPDGGGQREIVAGDERLLYRHPDEAIARIDRVLRDEGLRHALRAHLENRRVLFAPGVFVERVRRIVADFEP